MAISEVTAEQLLTAGRAMREADIAAELAREHYCELSKLATVDTMREYIRLLYPGRSDPRE